MWLDVILLKEINREFDRSWTIMKYWIIILFFTLFFFYYTWVEWNKTCSIVQNITIFVWLTIKQLNFLLSAQFYLFNLIMNYSLNSNMSRVHILRLKSEIFHFTFTFLFFNLLPFNTFKMVCVCVYCDVRPSGNCACAINIHWI